MQRSILPVMAILPGLMAGQLAPAMAQTSGGVVSVPNEDAAMAAAIQKATATLPKFFERLAKPQPGDTGFAVKIRFDTAEPGGNGEHIWANQVARDGDKISTTINNVPRAIPNMAMGQRVTVPSTQITDWMYLSEDKMHGAYTLRAILHRLPPEQAAAFKERLAPE